MAAAKDDKIIQKKSGHVTSVIWTLFSFANSNVEQTTVLYGAEFVKVLYKQKVPAQQTYSNTWDKSIWWNGSNVCLIEKLIVAFTAVPKLLVKQSLC